MSNNVDPQDGALSRPPTLLFVCIANVCRSPTMQFLTAHHLDASGIGAPWEVTSAGTSATEGNVMCETAAEAVRGFEGGADFAATHRARLLDAELVGSADLILVATHYERPVLTHLSPAARSRTFTMVEAALLAESALHRPRRPWREDAPFDGLVANMHAARGSISLPRGRNVGQRLLKRGHEPDGLDVPDVHTGRAVSHGRTMADLEWASERLAHALSMSMAPRPSA